LSPEIQQLIEDMKETMADRAGVGSGSAADRQVSTDAVIEDMDLVF